MGQTLDGGAGFRGCLRSGAMEDAFRQDVGAFLAARLAPRPPSNHVVVMGAGSDDLEGGRAFLATLAEKGLATPGWPREWGGLGASQQQLTVVAEELSRFESPDLYPFMVGIGLVGPTLMAHGTAEQCARWLPGIRTGAEIWCQLFSEPDAGSDLAGLAARAERDGDTWFVSGAAGRTTHVGGCCWPEPTRRSPSTRGSRRSPWTCRRPASTCGRCAR